MSPGLSQVEQVLHQLMNFYGGVDRSSSRILLLKSLSILHCHRKLGRQMIKHGLIAL
jgi:hypothetical protein